MFETLNKIVAVAAAGSWVPVLFLLTGGGLFFLFYSRLAPYRYFLHALQILRGKHDDPDAPGQISHYQALSTALASTVGMGNISGVAVAISTGGPGALFWMWVTAFIGMSTNFFTSALAILYRGKDSAGQIQGGPMYVIREGLSPRWHWMATLFSACCLAGTLPIFQANQLTQAIMDLTLTPAGTGLSTFMISGFEVNTAKLIIGILLTVLSGAVIVGGIRRIGTWSGSMVPAMILIYFLSVIIILLLNIRQVPYYLGLIFTDAFSGGHFKGDTIFGGVLGGLIVTGVRRAAFSNEAGVGTAPMALGAAKSTSPVKEGLVSMLSPAIDTLLVCTLTALAILVTGVWQNSSANGVTLTAEAFSTALPGFGRFALLISVFFFAVTSLFSYCYYGSKSFSYLFGAHRRRWYEYFYLFTITWGSVVSLGLVINIIDLAFAIMVIPTMISAMLLAPRVREEAQRYFAELPSRGSR
jgi:AGCS family alanine or glycine:cation symporter